MEPAGAAEGGAWVGASTAERIRTLLGARPFCLVNEKLTCTIFCVRFTRPDIGPFHAAFIINSRG